MFRLCQRPTKIGIWIKAGTQPAAGFTLFRFQTAIVSRVRASLSSLNFSLTSARTGWRSCIFLAIIACLRPSGNMISRTVIVSRMMAIP